MIITSIRIKTLNTGTKMVAVASLTIDGMIAIHGVKILKNQEGFFMAMPSKTIKPGQFEDIVHPISAIVRTSIENIIFKSYELCVEQNLFAVQLDVIDNNRSVSLLEQSIDDFQISVKKENSPELVLQGKNLYSNRHSQNEVASKEQKHDEAFWNWLNN